MRNINKILVISGVLYLTSCAPKSKTEFTESYPNGVLKKIEHFSNSGKLNGIQVYFYPNGNPEKIENFKNGVKEGAGFTFYENGQLRGYNSYVNDHSQKFALRCFENGNLKQIYSLSNGKGNGYYYNFFDTAGLYLDTRGFVIDDSLEYSYYEYCLNSNVSCYKYYTGMQMLPNFIQRFDESGRLLKQDGIILGSADIFPSKKFKLSENTLVTIVAHIATPINHEITASVSLAKGKLNIKDTMKYNGLFYYSNIPLSETGIYKYNIKAIARDLKLKKTIEENQNFEFIVE